MKVSMGWRAESKESCVGQMGDNLSTKGKGWLGNKRNQDIQQGIAREVEMEHAAVELRIVGWNIGVEVWWMASIS